MKNLQRPAPHLAAVSAAAAAAVASIASSRAATSATTSHLHHHPHPHPHHAHHLSSLAAHHHHHHPNSSLLAAANMTHNLGLAAHAGLRPSPGHVPDICRPSNAYEIIKIALESKCTNESMAICISWKICSGNSCPICTKRKYAIETGKMPPDDEGHKIPEEIETVDVESCNDDVPDSGSEMHQQQQQHANANACTYARFKR
ncbi:Protein Teyrha-meyrha [Eumeta japonica]|uniref:Protein Teyrha-meyrha n=1 Tax=Eumeta variegata TaxID=151549 RepID=A0A4C1SF28_EUMVA|nr:Protein Teyrha-meyrha [Eumeta japonica]